MAGLLSRWRGPMNQQLEMPMAGQTPPHQAQGRMSFMGGYPEDRLGPMPQFGRAPIPQMPPVGGVQGSPVSWSEYGFQNPDVSAEWQSLSANPKNPFGSADEYYKWHYGKFGQAEGRPGIPGAGSQPFVDPFAQKKSSSPVLPGMLGLMLQNPGKTTGAGALFGGLFGD